MRKPDRYTPYRIFARVVEWGYIAKNACDNFERRHLNDKLFDEVVAEKVSALPGQVKSLVTKSETKACMEQVLEITGGE